MPRTFAYLRVSTSGQTTDNQLQEIKAAGFKVEPRRVVTETVSGDVATAQRRGFTRLLDRLEPGEVRRRLRAAPRPGWSGLRASRTRSRCASIPADVRCRSPAFHAEQHRALPDQTLGASTASPHKQPLNRLLA
jgi:putative DNA-invertase from lambdoid prophage Rac